MPDDLLLPDGSHMRRDDVAYVFDCIEDGACCAVVGVSNMGKSALLRLVAAPVVCPTYLGSAASTYTLLLVDCNRMLELSEQGFYELVVRCMLDQVGADASSGLLNEPGDSVLPELQAAYDRLIHPHGPFDVPLSFNQAMTTMNRRQAHKLVLLFDEFDQALAGLHGRVFLNLRALKDQYKRRLVYVTATDHPLRQIRSDADSGEFLELFSHHVYYLPPLSQADVRLFAQRFALQEDITFDQADESFIYEWAGGHPGLLEASCRALGRVTGSPERDELQDWVIHREVAGWLPDEISVRVECRKIWEDLSDQEQEALLGVDPESFPLQEALDGLRRKHLLVVGQELPTSVRGDDQPRLFCRLFGEYVQRLRATRRPRLTGIRVDVEAGEVYVDGKQAETLTNLEYRLLLLLYGRLNQIVSKYDVVEAVWGEDYIEEVDDARIEKLVSRLRSKIEPDSRSPRYLVTVRGRGYKLEA